MDMQPDQTKTGMPDMRKSDARELLKKAKDRYKVMAEFDHENRQEGMEDLKFINEYRYCLRVFKDIKHLFWF